MKKLVPAAMLSPEETVDERLRALEHAVIAAPDDEPSARAFLASAARADRGGEQAPVPAAHLLVHAESYGRARQDATPAPFDRAAFESGVLLGPLLEREADRVAELDPGALARDSAGWAWLRAGDERGRALHGATRRLRGLTLEHLAREAPDSLVAWCALNVSLDEEPARSLGGLARVVAGTTRRAAERVARLLAQRLEPEVPRRLLELLHETPSEKRPAIYRALAHARAALEPADRDRLRAAITRELPAQRSQVYAVLARGSGESLDAERDWQLGAPEVRAAALELLVEKSGVTRAEGFFRAALVDRDPEVRRAAVRLLSGPTWSRHGRAVDWALGRLLDGDRAVRVEAARLLRRVRVPPRQLPRLRLILDGAPPGVRPQVERLLQHIEKHAR